MGSNNSKMASNYSDKAIGRSEPGYTEDEVMREIDPILKAKGIKLDNETQKDDNNGGNFGPLVGQGAFGKVFKYESNDKNSIPWAIKLIQLRRDMDKEVVINESETASGIRHRNILPVTSYGIWEEKIGFVYWYLFTDYCPGGNLETYLSEKRFLRHPEAQCLMKQIAAGMEYLHNKNIVHRDLKPDNILIEDKYHCLYVWSIRLRIADFGLAKVYEEVSVDKFESALRQYASTTPGGTISYMTPELFGGKGGICSDFWSMGVIAYRMLYGCVPFQSEKEVKRFINGPDTCVPLPESSMARNVMSSASPKDLIDFLREVLNKDPNKRVGDTRFYRLAWLIQFSADSMDRFCDDLTELITSYLSDKDCHRLQCVSKQWQRLVFNKKTELEINHRISRDFKCNKIVFKYYINGSDNSDRLKSLLKKCPNITRVVVNCDRINFKLIEVIAEYCQRLTALDVIDCKWSEEAMIRLGHRLGAKIRHLNYPLLSNIVGQEFLNLCPNIESIDTNEWSFLSLLNGKQKLFLPKLKSFNTLISVQHVSPFGDFCRIYGKQLKTCKLRVRQTSPTQIIDLLKAISSLEVITDLEIEIIASAGRLDVSREVTQIGNNCKQLKKVVFRCPSVAINCNLFKSLAAFQSLISLELRIPTNGEKAFENIGIKKNIKELAFIGIKVNDQMFDNIQHFVPNLEKICIHFLCGELSDKSLKSLSRLNQLKSLTLDVYYNYITDSGIKSLLDNCPLIRSIEFRTLPNITTETIDNLIAFANRRHKQTIRFIAQNLMNDKTTFPTLKAYIQSLTNIPNNLQHNLLFLQ